MNNDGDALEDENEEEVLGNEEEVLGNEEEVLGNEEEVVGNEEEVLGNEEEVLGEEEQRKYDEKKNEMKKYLPTIESLKRLCANRTRSRARANNSGGVSVDRLNFLYDVFNKRKRRLTYATLLRCEDLLESLSIKMKPTDQSSESNSELNHAMPSTSRQHEQEMSLESNDQPNNLLPSTSRQHEQEMSLESNDQPNHPMPSTSRQHEQEMSLESNDQPSSTNTKTSSKDLVKTKSGSYKPFSYIKNSNEHGKVLVRSKNASHTVTSTITSAQESSKSSSFNKSFSKVKSSSEHCEVLMSSKSYHQSATSSTYYTHGQSQKRKSSHDTHDYRNSQKRMRFSIQSPEDEQSCPYTWERKVYKSSEYKHDSQSHVSKSYGKSNIHKNSRIERKPSHISTSTSYKSLHLPEGKAKPKSAFLPVPKPPLLSIPKHALLPLPVAKPVPLPVPKPVPLPVPKPATTNNMWNPECPGTLRKSIFPVEDYKRRQRDESDVYSISDIENESDERQICPYSSLNGDKNGDRRGESKVISSKTQSCIINSFSPELSLDSFKKSQKDESDSDMITLKNSHRKLEALMYDRLTSMNANKMSVTNMKTIPKVSIPEKSDLPVDTLSSTFDEMMSNLSSKFRLSRSHTTEANSNLVKTVPNSNVKKLVPDSNSEKPVNASDDKLVVPSCSSNNGNYLDNKFIAEKKPIQDNMTTTKANHFASPYAVCSILTSQVQNVPFLEDDDSPICEPNLFNSQSKKDNRKLSTVSTAPSNTMSANATLNPNDFAKNWIFNPEREISENLKKSTLAAATKEFCPTKDPNSQNPLQFEKTNVVEDITCSTTVKSLEHIQPVPVNKNVSQHISDYTPLKRPDELDKVNQSVRSKLSEEISTLHKVGTSTTYSGALRGLINREKMMPPGRIASLKPGTLIDLIQEDKPQRIAHKPKNRPLSQQILSNDNNSYVKDPKETNFLTTQHDTNLILSKLSENDLKKLITENIEVLPTPPVIQFLNNSPSTMNSSVNNFSTQSTDPNSKQQITLHAGNLVINNICVQPTDYNFINRSSHIQNPQPNVWAVQNNRNDSWINNVSQSKDPRLDQNKRYNAVNDSQRLFDKSPYSTTKTVDSFRSNECTSEEPFQSSSYNQSSVHNNPFQSPFYDRSKTPDAYGTDGYPFGMQMSLETDNYKSSSSAVLRPSDLVSTAVTPISNSVHTPQVTIPIAVQRPPLLPTPPMQYENKSVYRQETPSFEGDRGAGSKFYSESRHQSSSNKEFRRTFADNVYDSWSANRNTHQRRHSPSNDAGFDRVTSNNQNYGNKYRWVTPNRQFDHAAVRDYEKTSCYNENVTPSSMAQYNPGYKKLAARDPRRKSIEESNNANETRHYNSSVHVPERSSSRRDPRVREKSTSRDRGRSRERTYLHEKSSSCGRGSTYERSTTRENEEFSRQKRHDSKQNQDSYSSPLESLYNSSMTPKTGLGYGIQKFRIPKLNRSKSDNSSTKSTSKEQRIKESLKDAEKVKRSVPAEEVNEVQDVTLTLSDEKVSQEDNTFNSSEENKIKLNSSTVDGLNKNDSQISDYDISPKTQPCNSPNIHKEQENEMPTLTLNNDLSENKNSSVCDQTSEEKDTAEKDDAEAENTSKCEKDTIVSENESETKLSLQKESDISECVEMTPRKSGSSEIMQQTIKANDKSTDENKSTKNCDDLASELTPELTSLQNKYGKQITTDLLKLLAQIISKEHHGSNVNDESKSEANKCMPDETQAAENTKEDNVGIANQEYNTKTENNQIVSSSLDLHSKEKKPFKTRGRPPKHGKYCKVKGTDSTKNTELIRDKNDSTSDKISLKNKKDKNESSNNKVLPKNNSGQKRKYRNELDRLQDDISNYHDSEAIAAASGLRLCRLQKEKTQNNTPNQVQKEKGQNNMPTQQSNKKRVVVKKIKLEVESQNNNEFDSDSSDSDSLFQLSQRLKSKYEPMIRESEERIRKEQLLKNEANKQISPSKGNIKAANVLQENIPDLTSEKQNDILTNQQDLSIEKNKEEGSKYVDSNECILKECSDKNTAEMLEEMETSSSVFVKLENISSISSNENTISIDTKRKSTPSTSSHNSNKIIKDGKIEENEQFNSLSRQDISNNILQKYKIKKQRKKRFWNLGIIKKKNKSKKEDTMSFNKDVDTGETSGPDDLEELIVPEPPDKHYFQDLTIRDIQCKLCSFKGCSIVNHYAINHPKDEVLISRMSPKAAEEALAESKIFFSIEENKKKMDSFMCRLCHIKFTKFSMFFEHVALHTGEFRHECCNCGYRTSTRSGILKHCRDKHDIKNSNKVSQRVLYKEPKNRAYFCGYLCSICNFFQIHHINVKRHFENNHEDLESTSNIIKINLSKIPSESLKLMMIEHKGQIVDKEISRRTSLHDEKEINAEGNEEDLSAHNNNILTIIKEKQSDEKATGISAQDENSSLASKNNDEVSSDNSLNSKETVALDSKSNSQSNQIKLNVVALENLKTPEEKEIIVTQTSSNAEGMDVTQTSENKDEEVKVTHTADNSKKEINITQTAGNLDEEINVNEISNNADINTSQTSENLSESTTLTMKLNASINSTDSDVDSLVQTIDPEVEKTPKSCFEPSVNETALLAYIETETNKIYKDTCTQSSATIPKKRNLNNTIVVVVEKKLSLEVDNPDNTFNVVDSLKNDWKGLKSKKSQENTLPINSDLENEKELIATEKQLIERICKISVKAKPHSSFVEDDFFEDSSQCLNEPEDDEMGSEAYLEETPTSLNIAEGNPFMHNNLLNTCQEMVTNKKSFVPKSVVYRSCLPTKSSRSEFIHVMGKIFRCGLIIEDIDIVVGDFRIFKSENDMFFKCNVHEWNMHCMYETKSLKEFGQHINDVHIDSYWNGTCSTCFSVFKQDILSHDNDSKLTQSSAFCHLVNEHLKLVESPGRVVTNGQCSSNGDFDDPPLEPARPLLRVRRLSGDMLSTPPGVNKKMSSNIKEGVPTSNTLYPVAKTPDFFGDKESPGKLSSMLGFPVEMLNVLNKVSQPEYNALTSAAIYKSGDAYKAMCTPNNLRQFYKCMGSNCSFTTSCAKQFAAHYDEHSRMSQSTHANSEMVWHWDICSYCFTIHKTSRDLCIHLRKDHGNCALQCGNCFYRANSIANVHFHHTLEHPREKFVVLQCKLKEASLPPIAEKPFTDVVIPLRCTKEPCTLFTYMLHSFCYHLSNVHKRPQCHICSKLSASAEVLVKHYKNTHGICIYQCLYCLHGTFSERQIRTHLCYKHPNSIPKCIHRTDSGGNKSGVPDQQESLRRIVFHKDHDKLLSYIVPYPETDETNSDSSAALSPEIKFPYSPVCPTRPVMFRGISYASTSTSALRKLTLEHFDTSPPGSPKIFIARASNLSPKTIRPINSQTMSKLSKIVPKPVIMTLAQANSKPTPISIQSIAQLNDASKSVIKPSATCTITSFANVVVTVPSASTFTSSVLSGPSATPKTTALPLASTVISSAKTDPVKVDLDAPKQANEPIIDLDISIQSSDDLSVDTDTSKQDLESESQDDENYFKCGNTGCYFGGSTSGQLKSHLVICDFARQTEKLRCAFCERYFKQVNSLITHLQLHGPPRFSCSVCSFKATMQARVVVHMKFNHEIYNTILIAVDPQKQDLEKDHFIVSPKVQERRTRGGEKPLPKSPKGAVNTPKTKYSPQEVHSLPKLPIFSQPLGCSLCVYETKVRSNLLRHMAQHTHGNIVCQEEFLNPVPIKEEKMFDKMMNLAGSSHKKRNFENNREADIACPYKYVPDQLRYMCHVKECGYRSLSETMLRDHVAVIHKEETSYICPHCPENDSTIPIDQLGLHLKLHDSPLFKCAYCDFYGHIRRCIEKHQSLNHSGVEAMIEIVRMNKPDTAQTQRFSVKRPFSQMEEPVTGEEWYVCDLCKFETKKKKFMLSHGLADHEMVKPYRCSICSYESANDTMLKTHFRTAHDEDGDSSLIMTFYKKVTQIKTTPRTPNLPLWKRDSKKIKLIRGISIDEKGDAPPPVATCVNLDINTVDRSQLKYGPYGSPLDGSFSCPRCSAYQTKNRCDFKEHLYKHFDYKPMTCLLCELSTTQKTKITKHINKVHNIDMHHIDLYIKFSIKEEFENWVDKTICTQTNILKEPCQKTEVCPTPSVLQINVKDQKKSVDDVLRQLTPPTLEIVNTQVLIAPPPPDVQLLQAEEVKNKPATSRLSFGKTLSAAGDRVEQSPDKKKKRDTNASHHRFVCCHCSKTAKLRTSLVNHSKKMHRNLPINIIPLKKPTVPEVRSALNCAYCDCVALNQSYLIKHCASKHKINHSNVTFNKVSVYSDLQYQCFWCKVQNNIVNLEEHCKKYHPEHYLLVVPIKVTKYKCADCSLIFNSMDMLKRHCAMHHPLKQYSSVNMTAQKRHSSSNEALHFVQTTDISVRPKKTYKCSFCLYTCTVYHVMLKHIESHFVSYLCSYCEKVFSSSDNIHIHIKAKHAGMEPRVTILKGSPTEYTKKSIIVILPSGKRRKITQEEIASEEKRFELHSELYMYDEPLEDDNITSPFKETARKSTSIIRSSRGEPYSSYTETLEESPNMDVVFISNNNTVKLPLPVLKRLYPLSVVPSSSTSEHP